MQTDLSDVIQFSLQSKNWWHLTCQKGFRHVCPMGKHLAMAIIIGKKKGKTIRQFWQQAWEWEDNKTDDTNVHNIKSIQSVNQIITTFQDQSFAMSMIHHFRRVGMSAYKTYRYINFIWDQTNNLLPFFEWAVEPTITKSNGVQNCVKGILQTKVHLNIYLKDVMT